MKSAWIIILSWFSMSSLAAAETFWQPDSRAPYFCMQNFNAYGPIYAGGVFERTEHMISYLKFIPKCDVIQLQEVWNDGQIQQLENSLSPQYNFSAPNKDARIGVMSLFMGDILGRQTVEFNVNNEGSLLDAARDLLKVKKAYHVVRTRFFAIDEDFYFMNTHLHPTSPAVRLTQILDILQWRLKNQDLKFLLSGDFNSEVDGLEREAMMLLLGTRDAMEESLGGYPKGFCTYCDENPLSWLKGNHIFDYILFSNVGRSPSSLRPDRAEVNMKGAPGRSWSDHYGVRVQFFVEPETTLSPLSVLETRQSKIFDVLTRTLRIFSAQRSPAFKPYVNLVKELQRDLESREGAFYAYTKKFY